MSKWRLESGYLARYMGSGLVNTVVGFGVIFLLTRLGVPALASNVAGYAVGLLLGFTVSKKFVFRSKAGTGNKEAVRYLAAFATAFLANLTVVSMALHLQALGPYFAQVLGVATYTVCMYLLSRYVVFREPPSGGR